MSQYFLVSLGAHHEFPKESLGVFVYVASNLLWVYLSVIIFEFVYNCVYVSVCLCVSVYLCVSEPVM